MTYCGYATYTLYYPEDQELTKSFSGLAVRASGLIDRATMGRTGELFAMLDEDDETSQAISLACATIVNALWQQEKAKGKTAGGAVTSANTDGYSESYASPDVSRSALQNTVRDVLAECLGADPYGLLYRGID